MEISCSCIDISLISVQRQGRIKKESLSLLHPLSGQESDIKISLIHITLCTGRIGCIIGGISEISRKVIDKIREARILRAHIKRSIDCIIATPVKFIILMETKITDIKSKHALVPIILHRNACPGVKVIAFPHSICSIYHQTIT